jgi:hypothetical protein
VMTCFTLGVMTFFTLALTAASISAWVKRRKTTEHFRMKTLRRRFRGALAANGFLGAIPPVDIRFPCFLGYMMLLRWSNINCDWWCGWRSLYTSRNVRARPQLDPDWLQLCTADPIRKCIQIFFNFSLTIPA